MLGFQQHHVLFALVAYWLGSAVIGGMPAPLSSSSQAYGWLYRTLHILAANVEKAAQKKFGDVLSPGDTLKMQNVQATPEGITAESAVVKKATEPPQA